MTVRLLAEVISSFDFFRDKKNKKPCKNKALFQNWLTKVYDLRKKYEQELAEMYLIINGMDDDLRQMMTIEKV